MVATKKTEDQDLFEAILKLQNKDELVLFFKDLCTPLELESLQERWKIAQLLYSTNLSYRDIHKKTGASLTTIGRVARFLKTEPYHGYKLLLDKLKIYPAYENKAKNKNELF